MSGYKQDLRDIAGHMQELRDNAETAESCICLVLSGGGQVYMKSTWETTNFSIIVLDGVQAWSRTVSAKDVVGIATSWNIDMGEFMKSARSHLCRQHPTSSYLLTPDTDTRAEANVVQLSFTIENLFEGVEGKETLNFNLHLTRISDVGAVFRDMLHYLLDTKDKLEEQLMEAENQYQKKLHQFAASEPEPSITLSLARPSANPRRQSSSFMEPRLLDFAEFNRSEVRDATRSVCTLTTMRAQGQLHHNTPKVATRLPLPPSCDLQDHGTKQDVNSTMEVEREPVSFVKNSPRSCAVNEGRMKVRNDDLKFRTREAYVGFDIPLSPDIMRVLNKFSGVGTSMQRNAIHRGYGDQNLHDRRDERDVTRGRGRDERGVKITAMRSPACREEQSQRSFKVETNTVCIGLSSVTNSANDDLKIRTHESPKRNLSESCAHEEEGNQQSTTILRQKSTIPESQPKLNADIAADFTRYLKYNGGLVEDMTLQTSETINWSALSKKKGIQENHNCNDVNGGILEKDSSNAGEGRNQVRGLNKLAEGEAKEGSDEEPTSKVTVEDVHLDRNNSDSGLRVKSGISEKPRGQRSNEARNTEEKYEKYEDQQKLADTGPHGPVRHNFLVENRLKSLWSDIIFDAIARPSTTRINKKLMVTHTPERIRQKSTFSHPSVVEHQGRKRTIENREDEFSGRNVSSVKLEAQYADLDGTEGTYRPRGGTKVSAQKFHINVKHKAVDLEEHEKEELQEGREHKRRRSYQVSDAPPGFASMTVAELLKVKYSGDEGRGRGRPSKGKDRVNIKTQGRLSADDSVSEKGRRCSLRSDRSSSEEGNVLDPDETNVDNFNVPDPDYYNFDKERTEERIVPGHVWAVYDEIDGFPRVWARINKVSREPQFEVLITWLILYDPSPEAEAWYEDTGYPVSCGRFGFGGEHVLTSINIFSHRMEYDWVSRSVVTIYPKKGEVWAMYTKNMLKSGSATPGSGGTKRPYFHVVHVLEDLGAEKRPFISVLERVKGFRTVWKPRHAPGHAVHSFLAHFSHKVPACQLLGHEGPNAAELKGFWDVDPAGLPTSQSG